jgi:ribokinase
MSEHAGGSGHSVVVVGSINHDLVCEVERIPSPGETVFATRTRSQAGGKGANQVVAAARAGANVALVGNIGDDEIGPVMLAALRSAGVAVAGVTTVEGARTGTAYITVGAGQNTIVVDRGANWRWPHGLAHAEATVRLATVVVAQMEVPDEIIRLAARASGSRFVLNAAPARPVPTDVLPDCDPLVVNEHELALLGGGTASDPRVAIALQRNLLQMGARSVVTTLGAAGAVWAYGHTDGHAPAPRIQPSDSTGAGDAFVGILATSLASGAELPTAVRRAVVGAALSVQRPGTHDSYPTAAEIDHAETASGAARS